MTKLEDPWVEIKRKELVRAIELAAGLWIDAAADVWNAPPGSEVELSLSVLNRSDYPLTWSGAEVRGVARESVEPEPGPLKYNRISRRTLALKIPQNAPYSQPAWLERSGQNAFYDLDDPTLIGLSESPPALQATFHLHDQDGAQVAITKPVLYRWVDRASGERIRSIEIVPAVAVGFSRTNLIFPDNEPRAVALRIVSNTSGAAGTASLTVPAGWRSIPETQPFEVTRRARNLHCSSIFIHRQASPAAASPPNLTWGDRTVSHGLKTIEYPHIPTQVVFPKAEMRVERSDIRLLAKRIGYVMGSGDRIPEALGQLGARVTRLSREDLASDSLTRFDTIILGIRALSTRPDVLAARERLLGYVHDGGTLIVQYNTVARRRGGPSVLAPFPMSPSPCTRQCRGRSGASPST